MRILLLLAVSVSLFSNAQKKTSQSAVDNSDSLLFSKLKYRLVGPFRGGRVAAVTGSLKSKNVFYFGSVGGSVWKTIDAGNNWRNVSDKYFGGSIGAVAIAPSDENIVYAGE